MAQSPLDLQRARKELEVLKQRERELEQRLGLGNESPTEETKTKSSSVFIDFYSNQNGSPSHERNETIVNGGSPFYLEPQTESKLTPSPIPLIIEEHVDTTADITSNESVTLNLQEDIEYDTDQYDGESLSEDSQIDVEINTEKYQENDSLENLNDISSDDGVTIDLRQKIREDIEENRRREMELQFERGSIENIVDYIKDTESDSDISEVVVHEDVREKILREIEAEKLRDLEIQARYKQEGFDIDDDHDTFEKTKIDLTTRDPKLMLEKELEELALREKELHQDDPNYGNDSFDESSIKEDFDTRGKIKRELDEQKERESEMQKLRKCLSNLNLASTDENNNVSTTLKDDEEDSTGEKIETIDTRQKIIHEIEEQRKREEEIKKRSGTEPRFHEITNTSDNEVDYVECQKLVMRKIIENEMNEYVEREKEIKSNKNNKEIVEDEITVIYNPQSSLLQSEKPGIESQIPLNKKFGSREDLLAHLETSEITEPIEKFQISTDEKIKEKRTFQAAVSKLQIPKIFMQDTSNQKRLKINLRKNTSPRQQQNKQNASEQVIIPKDITENHHTPTIQESYQRPKVKNTTNKSKDEIKTKKVKKTAEHNASKGRDKRKSTKELQVKRISTNPFSPRQKGNNPFTDDVTDGEKMNGHIMNGDAIISKDTLKDLNILPSDEATNLSKAKALIVSSKNPFKIALLAEHWEKKAHEQSNELNKHHQPSRKVAEKNDTTSQNKDSSQRTKRESLEFLWKSKKPIVTEDENPDKNDLELLTYMKEIRREYKQQNGDSVSTKPQQPHQQQVTALQKKDQATHEKPAQLQTAITLEKTIRKWEKRIAKHSTKNSKETTKVDTNEKILYV